MDLHNWDTHNSATQLIRNSLKITFISYFNLYINFCITQTVQDGFSANSVQFDSSNDIIIIININTIIISGTGHIVSVNIIRGTGHTLTEI